MNENSQRNYGTWAATGATLSAILSSACCWLPLVLLALGGSAAGVAGFFEAYRAVLLVATTALLGAGFYLMYFRRPQCAPGSACSVPNPKLARFNKGALWLATLLVAAFALFPTYVSALLDSSAGPAVDGPTVRLKIEGMTCEACSSAIEMELGGIPGVSAAHVQYDARSATIVVNPLAPPSEADLVAAVERAGYKARLRAPPDESHRP